MDARWFQEDRKLPKQDQEEAKELTRKALKNSTLLHRRLNTILTEMFEKTLVSDEDFETAGYEQRSIANASRRKTIRELQSLLSW